MMPETRTQEAIEEAAREGAAVVRDVLERRSASEDDLALARIAGTAMSNYARIYQANSAREATLVTIISHAAEGSDEFRRLVSASLPGSAVVKALADGRN